MENENLNTETETVKNTGSETETQTVQKNVVEITQEKLDQLIDKAYARGAKNAGSKGNNEELEALKGSLSSVEKELADAKKEALLQSKINAYEVEDQEVYKLLIEKNESGEDFDIDAFTNELKESRPNLFKAKEVEKQKFFKTDSSNNSQEVSLSEKIKGLSLKELEELSKNIN